MGTNLANTNVWETGTSKLVSIGKRYRDQNGRTFHYGYAASEIAIGKVAIAAASVANHTDLSFSSAPAANATEVSVTLGGTAATADQYKDGWLVVQDGTGEGRAYPIEGHPAQATTTGNLTVYLKEKLRTAGATAESNVDLVYNKYDELRPVPDNGQAYIPVGVPIVTIAASAYGWVQTWGPCAVWRDEATANLGEPITFGAGTGTGQIEGKDGATELQFGIDGPSDGVATEYQLCYLQLDP